MIGAFQTDGIRTEHIKGSVRVSLAAIVGPDDATRLGRRTVIRTILKG